MWVHVFNLLIYVAFLASLTTFSLCTTEHRSVMVDGGGQVGHTFCLSWFPL